MPYVRAALAGLLLLVAGCAHAPVGTPIAVRLIAFNDLHGNLEPPRLAIEAPAPGGGTVKVPAGGIAYLASAVAALKAANPNHAVVVAGDVVGASPLASALFLDEPTVRALDLIGVDYAAVGNHEFDKGSGELLRLAHGGCTRFTRFEPCGLDANYPGAHFGFLAANVVDKAGATLFPSYAIKSFGSGRQRVRIGFIGMTLTDTAKFVTPAGIAGLRFTDEAATANALVPALRREGADLIVLVIHQGAGTDVGYDDKSCGGLDGPLLPILARLDPAIEVVVSGHTHKAYVCETGGRLLTSAGRYGTLVTAIDLKFDPVTHRLAGRSADNVIVQGEGFGKVVPTDLYPQYPREPRVAALVDRYVAAAAPRAARTVGRLNAPATRATNTAGESSMGNLVADAQLAATHAPANGGAQIAFMNAGGLRTDLVPGADGSIDYGQLFGSQPFGNTLVVVTLTGAQIRSILEGQFGPGVSKVNTLSVSMGVRYRFDLNRPVGARIDGLTLGGAPIDDKADYRVTINSFLSSGGDGMTGFQAGSDPVGGVADLDALEAWLRTGAPLPATDRITDATRR